MYAATTNLGEVSGIIDTIKGVIGTVSKAIKVIDNGVQVVVHPPGLPPIMLNATDPDVLKKAVGVAKQIAGSITLQTGRAPSVADQVESAALSAVKSPLGIVAILGGGLLLLSFMNKRHARAA